MANEFTFYAFSNTFLQNSTHFETSITAQEPSGIVKTSSTDYSTVSAAGDFDKALGILETYIKPKDKGGKPLVIGVHYPKTAYPGYENDCTATFHYMVVVGKGYDKEKNQNYFRFYDVGRTEEAKGANPLNRLYVDKKNKKISGTYKDKLYTITEVRSNHE